MDTPDRFRVYASVSSSVVSLSKVVEKGLTSCVGTTLEISINESQGSEVDHNDTEFGDIVFMKVS